jgi:type II secretory pathway pseudopilin PulG
MVVIVIIGILAVISLPMMRNYIVKGRLEDAKPYLMAIAAKARARINEFGEADLFPNTNAVQEQSIVDRLGVDVTKIGDYCFMVVHRDNGISTDDGDTADFDEHADLDFEVWAVLRAETTDTTVTPTNLTNPETCTVATNKEPVTGWVASNSLGERIIVLRSPSFGDNLNDGYNWVAGITDSDVFQ